jgi:hypothetical protein
VLGDRDPTLALGRCDAEGGAEALADADGDGVSVVGGGRLGGDDGSEHPLLTPAESIKPRPGPSAVSYVPSSPVASSASEASVPDPSGERMVDS